MDDIVSSKRSNQTLRLRMMERFGKFSWIGLVNQFFLGMGLIYIAIILAKPYLSGYWWIAPPIMGVAGIASGFYMGIRVDTYRTSSGVYIYDITSLWKKFAPFLLILFVLRIVLRFLSAEDIVDFVRLIRMLPFFGAGMVSTRAVTIIIRLWKINNRTTIQADDQDE